MAYDAETLANVRTWPWNVAFGQIGTKSTPLLTKIPGVPLPPDMAPAIRAEERQEAAERRQQQLALPAPVQQPGGEQRGDLRQAGPDDEAASDPTSLASSSTSSTSGQAPMVDDDTTLDDLLTELKDKKEYSEGVEMNPKREGEDLREDVQSPSKSLRSSSTRKAPRLEEPTRAGAAASSATAEGQPNVRMVIAGELLEDGDLDLTFPDRPPDLDPETLFEIETKAVETEITRLVEMGVLQHPGDQDLSGVETLSTKFVLD